jgi:cytochrome P450
MMVLCRFIGVPLKDLSRFSESAVELELMGASPLKPVFPKLEKALYTLRDYIIELVAMRKAEPQDDFISALILAQAEEDVLTEQEVVWSIVNLLFAGQDTTRFQLASAIRALIEHGVWDTLATRPEAVTKAMDEALRIYPVVQFLLRIPRVDVVIDGYEFPAGERVILNMIGASRDPRIFTAPDAFDMERPEEYGLLFGYGLHYCVGRPLARLEMQLAIETLSRRIPQARIAGEVSATGWQSMLGGPHNLRLEFEPA